MGHRSASIELCPRKHHYSFFLAFGHYLGWPSEKISWLSLISRYEGFSSPAKCCDTWQCRTFSHPGVRRSKLNPGGHFKCVRILESTNDPHHKRILSRDHKTANSNNSPWLFDSFLIRFCSLFFHTISILLLFLGQRTALPRRSSRFGQVALRLSRWFKFSQMVRVITWSQSVPICLADQPRFENWGKRFNNKCCERHVTGSYLFFTVFRK